MGSKYVEDLEAWVKAKAIKKPDANVAAFLAVRDLVKARLDDGYSATIIHEFLRAGQHIDICYGTFLKYVHRYVQPPRKGPKARGRSARTVGHVLSAVTASTGKGDTSSGILGFTFNSNPKSHFDTNSASDYRISACLNCRSVKGYERRAARELLW